VASSRNVTQAERTIIMGRLGSMQLDESNVGRCDRLTSARIDNNASDGAGRARLLRRRQLRPDGERKESAYNQPVERPPERSRSTNAKYHD
jgi:hypothetical protein